MKIRFLPETVGLLLLATYYFSSGIARVVVGIIVVALVGIFIAYAHRRFIHGALAISVGLVPFGSVPGIDVSLVLILIVWMWADTILNWHKGDRRPSLEWWAFALTVTAGISLIAVRIGDQDLAEFLKWFVATSLILPLTRLSTTDLVRFGRIYAISTAVAATIGALNLTVDRSGLLMKPFNVVGYAVSGTSNIYAYGSNGKVERLTGTFLNPNGAGIFLLIALVLCVALFGHRTRLIVGIPLAAGIALTLSRSAIGGLVLAAVLLLILHPMNVTRRARTVSILGIGLMAAILTPTISTRITDSFGSSDFGSRARGSALEEWPHKLSGHWLFGLGWGRPEFLDPLVGIQVNYVANAALLTIYRAGLIVGLIFVAMLVHACIKSYFATIGGSWAAAAIGAGFLGFALVTLQLDFPVVTIAPITAAFSVFLAFVTRADDIADWDLSVGREASIQKEPSFE